MTVKKILAALFLSLLTFTSMVSAQSVDTVFPSDVANVKAVGGDAKVTLSWDASTDNVGVKGYKIFYGPNTVTAETGSYTQGPIDTGNVLSYEVTGLENGKTYYFAVTAYDAAGNESEFYSTETSATSSGSAKDEVAPRVASAEALDKNTVKVVFSEAVVIPETTPASAFAIKNDTDSTALEVKDALLDASDLTGKTVLLDTADQTLDVSYLLTAGVDVKDKAGNPIVSGTSDTAVFKGTDLAKPELKPAAVEEKDTTGPSFVDVKATDSKTVAVTFSEPVVLKADAKENFIVTEAADNTKLVTINNVEVGATGMIVTLTTADLAATTYNLIAVKVMDAAGNEMDPQNNATTFQGMAPAGSTTIQTLLENAAKDFVAQAVGDLMVKLTWSTDAEKLAKIADFVLYMSKDKGVTWGKGIAIGKDQTYYTFQNLTAGMTYYFKLVARDAEGNESDPLTAFLTLGLPSTGPELALLALFSLGGGAFVSRKKKARK